MKTYTYLSYTNLKRYIVRDREAGNYIADFDTPEEALAQLREWEAEDEADGIAEDNFYEVLDLET